LVGGTDPTAGWQRQQLRGLLHEPRSLGFVT
jgi:hypothetical protein